MMKIIRHWDDANVMGVVMVCARQQSRWPETLDERREQSPGTHVEMGRTLLYRFCSTYSLPALLALLFPFPCAVPLPDPGLDPDEDPGAGYAFMMLANVAGTGGGDGWVTK